MNEIQGAKEKSRICGKTCHPGDDNCNGYCTGKEDAPATFTETVVGPSKPCTLEDLLRTVVKSASPVTGRPIEYPPEFRVAVQGSNDASVFIIIHANGHNSETLDFNVSGNTLTQL